MAGTRELTVKILGNAAGAQKAFEAVHSASDKTGAKTESLTKKLGNMGKNMTTKVTLPIVAGLGLATKAASDLNETVAKVGVVFGDQAKTVSGFADQMAKDFGIPKTAILDAASAIGLIGKASGLSQSAAAKMSTEMAKLAVDASSFYNVPLEEALAAIKSGLVGEAEPMRRFGVLLDEAAVKAEAARLGFKGVNGELTQGEKSQARASLIMKGMADASGDLERTQDSLANKLREMRGRLENVAAELGTTLIPIVVKGSEVVAGLASKFSDLSPAAQTATLVGVGTIAALGPAFRVIDNTSRAVQGLSAAYKKLGTARVAGLSAIGIAVSVLAVGFVNATAKAEKFIESVNKKISPNDPETYRKAINALGQDLDKHGKILDNTLNPYRYLQAGVAMDKNADAAVGLKNKLLPLEKVLDAAAKASGTTRADMVRLADSMGIDLSEGADDAGKKLTAAALAMQSATPKSEALGEAQETLASKTATATEKLDAFRTSLDLALGATLNERDAARDLAERTEELGKVIEENGSRMGLATEQQRAVGEAFDNSVEAILREVEAITKSGQISGDAAAQKQAIIQRLEELRKKFPQLGPAIDEYVKKIGTIPDKKVTTIELAFGEGARETPRGDIKTRGGTFYKASGGPIYPGSTYLTGEEGPELITVGGAAPMHVTPAKQTAAAIGGGTNIAVYAQTNADPWEISREIAWALR